MLVKFKTRALELYRTTGLGAEKSFYVDWTTSMWMGGRIEESMDRIGYHSACTNLVLYSGIRLLAAGCWAQDFFSVFESVVHEVWDSVCVRGIVVQ